MAFSKRKISLQFQLGQGDFGEAGMDAVDLKGLRCSVNVVRVGRLGSQADIAIYGMKLPLMQKLTVTKKTRAEQQRYNQVIVKAGDERSGMAMCFGGTVQEAWIDARQAPDVTFYVSAISAQFKLLKPAPAISFKGAADAALVLSGIAQQMGYTFRNGGVSGGVTATLHNPYKPGSPKAQLESVCRDIDCEYDVDELKKELTVWPKDQPRNGQVVRITSDTGLIGYPSFTQGGIQFSCLYNPNLTFGAPVEIESQLKAANGQWKVYRLAHRLESEIPGGQWFTDVECSYMDYIA